MSGRSIEARLVKLEDRRPHGCPACDWWTTQTWTIVREDEFGHQTRGEPNRPDSCPRCGRVVPVLSHREIIVARVTRSTFSGKVRQ